MKEKFKQWIKDNTDALNQISSSLAESEIETENIHIMLDKSGYVSIELDYTKDMRAARLKSDEPFKLRTMETIE